MVVLDARRGVLATSGLLAVELSTHDDGVSPDQGSDSHNAFNRLMLMVSRRLAAGMGTDLPLTLMVGEGSFGVSRILGMFAKRGSCMIVAKPESARRIVLNFAALAGLACFGGLPPIWPRPMCS